MGNSGLSSEQRGEQRAARFLEWALLFTLVVHGAAMVAMLPLLPGVPGGLSENLADRARYVAQHSWIWRLGWVPWQVTAISDLILALALCRSNWIPKLPAILTLIVTAGAISADLSGQFLWVWYGPAVARHAGAALDWTGYGALESRIFYRMAGLATLGYVLAALGWTWCFAGSGMWSPRLTWISSTVWPMFAIATVVALLPASIARPPWLTKKVGAGNAIGFIFLMIWLASVTEIVLLRRRPVTTYGRHAVARYPSTGLLGWCWNLLANSRVARAIVGLLPALAMDSDITDVVYVNYVVEAEAVEGFVERPLELQRLGPNGRYTLFTVLTFRHGHFGPRCLGPLRKLWRSPIQSNWRIHVYDPVSGKRGIQFLTIAIAGPLYALAARLLAENIPMNVPAGAKMDRGTDGTIDLQIAPGTGSAPDVTARFTPSDEPDLASPWTECFGNWRGMLEYCVPQDRAMSAQPWNDCVVRQEINLNIPLESCKPMRCEIKSKAARAVAGEAEPLCFLVEKLSFRLLGEERDCASRTRHQSPLTASSDRETPVACGAPSNPPAPAHPASSPNEP
jgi:hypothetical protein